MKIKIINVCVLITFIGIPFSVNSDPYSHCSQILKDGAFNIAEVNRDTSTKQYSHVWLCSQEYKESNSKTGANISAVYGAISGSGAYNKSNFNKYKNNYCNFDSSSYSAVEKSYMYNQVASSEIVSAWKTCIGNNNKGLVCSAEKINDTNVIFKIGMNHGPAGELGMTKMQMKNLKDVFGNTLNESISEGDEYVFNLSRPDVNSPGIVMVTGKTNLGTTYCNYRVPVTSTIQLPDLEIEKLRNLLSSGNFDTGNHKRNYSTQGGKCSVTVHEKLTVTNATVSKNKDKIHVAYTCKRPDHRYNCGGGWTRPVDASYSGKVSANLKISSGVASIFDVIDHNNNEERNCGNIVSQHLRSLDGSSL